MRNKLSSKLFPFTFGCIAAGGLMMLNVGCDVKKTQEGEMPAVKVEGGQVPKYDVDVADVSVKEKKTEITVPKVTTEKKVISVPDVEVTMPSEKTSVAPPPQP